MSAELEAVYRAYIDTLNQRRFDDLAQFVHDRLVYNDKPMTLEQYVAERAAEARAIPDLYYDVQLLVVDDDRVACRIWFDVTPQQPFLDIEPTGHRAAFAEHVFYRFRDDRIVQVWSLLDTDAIRRRLT